MQPIPSRKEVELMLRLYACRSDSKPLFWLWVRPGIVSYLHGDKWHEVSFRDLLHHITDM